MFVEIFSHSTVSPNGLELATSDSMYAVFMDLPPAPPTKVDTMWPFTWDRVWSR